MAWLAVTLVSSLLSLLQEHRFLCPEWARQAVSLRAFALPVPSRWNTFFIPTWLPPLLHVLIQRSPISEALLSRIVKTPQQRLPPSDVCFYLSAASSAPGPASHAADAQ